MRVPMAYHISKSPTQNQFVPEEAFFDEEAFREGVGSLNLKEKNLNDFLETLPQYVMDQKTPNYKLHLMYAGYVAAFSTFFWTPLILFSTLRGYGVDTVSLPIFIKVISGLSGLVTIALLSFLIKKACTFKYSLRQDINKDDKFVSKIKSRLFTAIQSTNSVLLRGRLSQVHDLMESPIVETKFWDDFWVKLDEFNEKPKDADEQLLKDCQEKYKEKYFKIS